MEERLMAAELVRMPAVRIRGVGLILHAVGAQLMRVMHWREEEVIDVPHGGWTAPESPLHPERMRVGQGLSVLAAAVAVLLGLWPPHVRAAAL